jgi:hypothetical protein
LLQYVKGSISVIAHQNGAQSGAARSAAWRDASALGDSVNNNALQLACISSAYLKALVSNGQ